MKVSNLEDLLDPRTLPKQEFELGQDFKKARVSEVQQDDGHVLSLPQQEVMPQLGGSS
jgi:hypothetical protein